MTTAVTTAALRAPGETPTGRFAVVTRDDTRRCLSSMRRSSGCELAVRRDAKPKVLNALSPFAPISGAAPMVRYGQHAQDIGINSVHDGIGISMNHHAPGVACGGCAHDWVIA
ncbi:MAG TPA: hypothetical protein VMV64_03255 [Sulfuricella sp.]|nr:hypothetical protein [Sulfuricella sp.]HUX62752.1 hypothetical protein [Sulfuricella sp.]